MSKDSGQAGAKASKLSHWRSRLKIRLFYHGCCLPVSVCRVLVLKEACRILHDRTHAPCKHLHACPKKGMLFLEMPDSLNSPVMERHSDIPSLLGCSLQLCSVKPNGGVCGRNLATQAVSVGLQLQLALQREHWFFA